MEIISGKVHDHLSLSHLMVDGTYDVENLCGATGHLSGTRTRDPKYVNCLACQAAMARKETK